jgi:hypothetical protein
MQRQDQLGIFYFKVVGTIFSSSLQKRWIVYLRGWSDKLICTLDLAWAGVALVRQIE